MTSSLKAMVFGRRPVTSGDMAMSFAEIEATCLSRLADMFEHGTTQTSASKLFDGLEVDSRQKHSVCESLRARGVINPTYQLGQKLPYFIEILPSCIDERDRMAGKPGEHGEPPGFVKWLIWLFRKDTWTKHPVIATVATIIIVSVAVTAVSGVVRPLLNGTPPDDVVVKDDRLELVEAAFVEKTEPRHSLNDNKLLLDVLLRNVGSDPHVVTGASFNVKAAWKLEPVEYNIAAAFPPPDVFSVTFPTTNLPQTVSANDVKRTIETGKNDRFQFDIQSDTPESTYIFHFSVRLEYDNPVRILEQPDLYCLVVGHEVTSQKVCELIFS